MGRDKPGKPRRARIGNSEIEGSGIYVEPRVRQHLRDPGAGKHLWIATAAFRLSDEQARLGMEPGNQVHLDLENLAEFAVGCFKCQEPYSLQLGAQPCPGQMGLMPEEPTPPPKEPVHHPADPEHIEDESVVIGTEPDENGRYYVYMSVGKDTTWTPDPEEVLRYCRYLSFNLARVEHDTAVLRTFIEGMNMDPDLAAQFVGRDLAPDRGVPEQIGPLTFTPVVGKSRSTGKFVPLISVEHAGRELGRWDTDQAREHLNTMQQLVEVADLDSALYRVLRHTINLEDGPARALIHSMWEHRE